MLYRLVLTGTFFEGSRELGVEATTLAELHEGVRRGCGLPPPSTTSLNLLVLDPDFGELCELEQLGDLQAVRPALP
jgi:hypothetical protein